MAELVRLSSTLCRRCRRGAECAHSALAGCRGAKDGLPGSPLHCTRQREAVAITAELPLKAGMRKATSTRDSRTAQLPAPPRLSSRHILCTSPTTRADQWLLGAASLFDGYAVGGVCVKGTVRRTESGGGCGRVAAWQARERGTAIEHTSERRTDDFSTPHFSHSRAASTGHCSRFPPQSQPLSTDLCSAHRRSRAAIAASRSCSCSADGDLCSLCLVPKVDGTATLLV